MTILMSIKNIYLGADINARTKATNLTAIEIAEEANNEQILRILREAKGLHSDEWRFSPLRCILIFFFIPFQ